MFMTNEQERLHTLYSYEILDTDSEESFDNLTRLAAQICGTSTSVISFVDHERQWFKSCYGTGLKETARSVSFCTHTIKQDNILEVSDATLDERFKNNPKVTEDKGIRFYAGCPVVSPEGYNLGTLCVFDTVPRTLNDEQRRALKILAAQVMELVLLRKKNLELIDAKKLLEEQQELLVTKARLQTIGELASGICHQINNPLAIIRGRSMILRGRLEEVLPKDHPAFKEIDNIDSTAERVSGILKALRFYAKDPGNEVKEHSLREILEDTITLIKARIRSLEVDFEYDQDSDVMVTLNKNQLSQVLMDVLTNALDSLEESDKKVLRLTVHSDHAAHVITITDSGGGIKEENKKKIFEPFFTTKARHFGVGLSNATNFMTQNNGQLKLVKLSNPTTFDIILPKKIS